MWSATSTASLPWRNNKKPRATLAEKTIVKNQIVSSKFGDVKQFVPSYDQTNAKPEINALMSMEYAKIWQEEHKTYQKNVIGKILIKKPALKRPTFQSSKCPVQADAEANSNNSNRQPANRIRQQVKSAAAAAATNNNTGSDTKTPIIIKNAKPNMPVWRWHIVIIWNIINIIIIKVIYFFKCFMLYSTN